METVKKIAKGILRSLWGCTLDIWDAYFFIPINWEFHKFLAFKLGGRTFVFQFLPFGLSPAPWTFSRVITPIKKYLHKMLILLHAYLDDFLILARSPRELKSSTVFVIKTLESLGFIKNEKSHTILRNSLSTWG